MVDFSAAEVHQVSVHHVGNAAQGETVFLSEQPALLDEPLSQALLQYCANAFAKVDTWYRFDHQIDQSYHVLQGLCTKRFDGAAAHHEVSQSIVQHLFQQSRHPHIKSGDVLVVSLDQIIFGDIMVDGLAIIKSESSTRFLSLDKRGNHIDLQTLEGIHLKRMDKGALILNIDGEEGYRIVSIDTNRYDAAYWLDDFLGVTYLRDDQFDTKAYIEMCKGFASEVVKTTADKKTEVDFVHQTFQFLDQSPHFTIDAFKETFFEDEAISQRFDQYKAKYESDHGLELSDAFIPDKQALSRQKQKLRNHIQLDTNIKIQLGFANTDSVDRFIERGWDDEKQMYYYKCYFNTEK